MKRTSKGPAIAVIVAAVCLTIISTNHVAQAQISLPVTITNTYAAKFICGVQPETLVSVSPYPDAQAGRYSTKVNVHNNTGTTINFRKKIIRLSGNKSDIFEQPTDPVFKVNESLKEDQAMEVVCRDIYRYVGNPVAPWPYIEGFVIFEVLSVAKQTAPPPDPLDVEGIYTYKGDQPGPGGGSTGSGVSIEVVVYPAKSNVHILH